LSAINPSSAALAIGTSAAMFMLPKVHTKLPSALLAVGGATLATHGLGLDVSLIGAIPSGLEAFKFGLPMLPAVDSLPSLAATTLMIYSMTSVESLLSCAALEKMKKTSYKHSPDQELVGQGLANMGSALFMGMPVTSVIARSGLNVKLNASTRLPALVQAGFVFGSVVFFSDSIAMIPMPALSGMLITTGCSMLNPTEFKHCFAVQKIDTVPFIATIGGMVSLGLAEGIGIGCATALALNYQNWNPAAEQTSSSIMKALEAPTVFHKMVQGPVKHNHERAHTIGIFSSSHGSWNAPEDTNSRMVKSHEAHMYHTTAPVSTFQDEAGERLRMDLSTTAVWQLNGPINFISMFEIDNMIHDMQDRLATDGTSVKSVVVDMHRVSNLEFTGIEELVTRLVEVGDAHETPIQMVNCSEVIHKALDQCDPSGEIERYSALKAAI
jgi:MFS superfamily sulfate permease-like transporter